MKEAITLIAACALLFSADSGATTMARYKAKCKAKVQSNFKFEGLCDVAVGPEDASGRVIVFRVTPPYNGKEITIRAFPKRTATVDDVPAKEIAIVPGWFHFETSEGLDLRFTKPPADMQM